MARTFPAELLGPWVVLWPDPVEGPFRIVLRWKEEGGRATCSGLSIDVREGSDLSLTTSILRKLKLDTLVREARQARATPAFGSGDQLPGGTTDMSFEEDTDPDRRSMASRVDPTASATRSRRPMTDELLRHVASVYARAFLSGEPPRRAVAATFGVSSATASRWIASARRRGFLESTTAGRAWVGPTPGSEIARMEAPTAREPVHTDMSTDTKEAP